MGYSVRQNDKGSEAARCDRNVFSQEDWGRYNFAAEEDIAWFSEGKYGLFLHVGISAVGMVDISWPRRTHALPDPPYPGKNVENEVYDNFAKQLKFECFNAKNWASLAKKSGYKYVVIITKHHDGFHMWDTAYSEYKITNTPFGRDYLREVIGAFRAEGLKIGLYYSKRDWTHPDYEPVSVKDAVATKKPPFFKMNNNMAHYITDKHKKYLEYMFNTVRELMTNYGTIDLLWWDAEWNLGMFTKEMWDSWELEKMIKQLQPHIVINNRAGLPGDYDTPEGEIGFFQNKRRWETCMPLGKEWAYTGDKPKSTKKALMQLLNCVGGDGNYLVSIGCKPNGEIAGSDAAVMTEIGEFLAKYGDSIYGTRGGIWKPTKEYMSCRKGNTVYLHILKSSPIIKLNLPVDAKLKVNATCLTGEKTSVIKDGGQLKVKVMWKKRATIDTIIKLEFTGGNVKLMN